MDNKKWGSRFATVFWWTLSILPLLIPLIQFIGYHLTFNSGISTANELTLYHNDQSGSYINMLNSFNSTGGNVSISPFVISFIKSMFLDLFVSLGFSDFYSTILGCIFGWMVSVQFYHLLFDFIVWLPRWFHKIMGKGFDDLQ